MRHHKSHNAKTSLWATFLLQVAWIKLQLGLPESYRLIVVQ